MRAKRQNIFQIKVFTICEFVQSQRDRKKVILSSSLYYLYVDDWDKQGATEATQFNQIF